MNRELVLQNVTAPLAREVEVGVIGQVYYRVFVGGGPIIDLQIIAASGKRVGDFDR